MIINWNNSIHTDTVLPYPFLILRKGSELKEFDRESIPGWIQMIDVELRNAHTPDSYTVYTLDVTDGITVSSGYREKVW